MPHFDELIGTWVGPFFMAPTNAWVVRRSASLFEAWDEPYPAGFTYREFLKYLAAVGGGESDRRKRGDRTRGRVMIVPPLFRAILPLLPQPGEGPSEADGRGLVLV